MNPVPSRFAAVVCKLTIAFFLLCGVAEAQRPRARVLPPNSNNPNTTNTTPLPKPLVPPQPRALPVPEEVLPPNAGLDLIAALKVQNDAIHHRLAHRLVNGSWRKESMPSGAAGMNLFANFDHEAKLYSRNPDLWAQDLVRHFTGVVIYNDMSQESYGGVLITPRHLLFCAHAHPHAHLTWGPHPERPGAVHRFLTTSGKLVESLQLHQAKSIGSSLLPGLASVDLCVALLDRDLEKEGLKVVPVFPAVSDADVSAATKWSQKEKQPFAFIGMSQGTSRTTNSEPPKPISDYPRKHQRMCYIKDRNDMTNTNPVPGPFAAWNYSVWDGDSGTPTFLLLNGEPHLWSILNTSPGNGPRVGSHIDHVNALIAAADENAISLGRLEKPTGLKLRVAGFKP